MYFLSRGLQRRVDLYEDTNFLENVLPPSSELSISLLKSGAVSSPEKMVYTTLQLRRTKAITSLPSEH
jgi:hypothetical protein